MTKTLKEGKEEDGRERDWRDVCSNSLLLHFVSDDQTRDDVHKESMFMTGNNKTIQCLTKNPG